MTATTPEWETAAFVVWLERHDGRAFVRETLREYERLGYGPVAIQALRLRLAATPGLTGRRLLGGAVA